MSPLPKQVLNFILKFFFIYLVLVSLLYFTGAKDGFSTWFAPKAESLFKNSIENIQIGIKANKFEEFDLKTTFIDMIELENQKNIDRHQTLLPQFLGYDCSAFYYFHSLAICHASWLETTWKNRTTWNGNFNVGNDDEFLAGVDTYCCSRCQFNQLKYLFTSA